MEEEQIIYIGTKPVKQYALKALSVFQTTNRITLKARGKAIIHAVDVNEVLKNRFMKDLVKVVDIKTNTETVTNEEGKSSNISSIEIILEKVNRTTE